MFCSLDSVAVHVKFFHKNTLRIILGSKSEKIKNTKLLRSLGKKLGVLRNKSVLQFYSSRRNGEILLIWGTEFTKALLLN